MCPFLKSQLEEEENDDICIKRHKSILRACVKALMNYHRKDGSDLRKMYTDPKEAHKFIKAVLNRIGLSLRATNRRVSGSNKRKSFICSPHVELTLIFGLKKFSNAIKDLVQLLLISQNIDDEDKEWIKDSINVYNEMCNNCHCEDKVFVVNYQRETIGVCIRQRIEEERVRRNALQNSLEAYDIPTHSRRELDAVSTLARLNSRANRILEDDRRRQHEVYIRRSRISAHESNNDDGLYDTDGVVSLNDDHVLHNDDGLHDTDGEDDEEDDDEEDVNSYSEEEYEDYDSNTYYNPFIDDSAEVDS